MTDWIQSIVRANLAGETKTIPSICSAHPDVLGAAMLLAKENDQQILIESTSNQVNQFGGYTGMRPADFVTFVHKICDQHGFNRADVAFGGDHLGPQVWRGLDADTAMANATEMMKEYAAAGYTKIHLDCSQGCHGEPTNLSDELVATRAADLAAICEQNAPNPDALLYVVGTEVPPPGGARPSDADHGIHPTDPSDASATIDVHRRAFTAKGLDAAWERVIALVVQPGLEFGPVEIDHFNMEAADNLSSALANTTGICFEAHSTDYQRPEVFPELARRHFAILKVGPALTFAYRQAIYALDHIRGWLEPSASGTTIRDHMEALMCADDSHWKDHYSDEETSTYILRHFGWADRIRYYWSVPGVQQHIDNLEETLANQKIPLPLCEQYFSNDVITRADALQSLGHSLPKALIYAQIQAALAPYFIKA